MPWRVVTASQPDNVDAVLADTKTKLLDGKDGACAPQATFPQTMSALAASSAQTTAARHLGRHSHSIIGPYI